VCPLGITKLLNKYSSGRFKKEFGLSPIPSSYNCRELAQSIEGVNGNLIKELKIYVRKLWIGINRDLLKVQHFQKGLSP